MCYMGAHCHNLVNMIEPSMCGVDAALCQIALTTYCPVAAATNTYTTLI